MRLFQTEMLRESPRPIARSYARPAYGPRHARRLPAPVELPPDGPAAMHPGRETTDAWPELERAA